MAPGINALKTFDPPLEALAGRTITGVRRIGKHLAVDVSGDLVAADPPHERRAPAALRQARRPARPHVAAAHPDRRRARAAAARVRHQAGGVGEAPGRRRGRRGGGHREARAGGVAGPARRPAPAAEGPAPAAHAAARPARDRGDRPLVGRRDPLDREAVAVQARQRPRRGARRRRCARRSSRRSTPRSSTTSRSSSCRSPTSCRCRCRSTARPASRARAAARRSRPSTTRTTSCATAREEQTGGKVLKDRRLSRLLK